MFINLNYSLSIILHVLVVCCLIFIFKIERQTNIYNDVININLKTLKTFKTEDISKEKNSIDLKKDKESKKEINENTQTITEIITPKKEIKQLLELNGKAHKLISAFKNNQFDKAFIIYNSFKKIKSGGANYY